MHDSQLLSIGWSSLHVSFFIDRPCKESIYANYFLIERITKFVLILYRIYADDLCQWFVSR